MTDPVAGLDLAPGTPEADRHWMMAAIELSRRCTPSRSAFSVGAVLVDAAGQELAAGYSREVGPRDHAEEVAVARAACPEAVGAVGARLLSAVQAAGSASLSDATLYSSLEPCISRASRPVSCAELIVAAGIRRVVIAWREPPVFVPGGGAVWLAGHGVTVVDLPELTELAREVNAGLLG
jgi:diaminohydroxyphosphoribosylaminopyrimidine deaminase / 5-amino-6-(5-phosphoribosylamino)uracil reductase